MPSSPLGATRPRDVAAANRRDGARWYAVVLHFGPVEDTRRCVASLDGLGFFRVLVVDNGTGAPELERLAAGRPWLRLIRNHENVGYGAGNNVGLHAACEEGAEFVAVVNNDVAVEYPAMLEDAAAAFHQCDAIGSLSPPVFLPRHGGAEQPGRSRFQRLLLAAAAAGSPAPRCGLPASVAVTPSFSGCCWMAPAAVLAEVGPLREDLFLYHEELEFAVRLRRAGRLCARIGSGRGCVFHWGTWPGQAYYLARNLVLLVDGFPLPARRRLLGAAAVSAAWLALRCLGDGRAQAAADAVRGFADGVRGRRGERSRRGA